jgi:hypothetical protein
MKAHETPTMRMMTTTIPLGSQLALLTAVKWAMDDRTSPVGRVPILGFIAVQKKWFRGRTSSPSVLRDIEDSK